MANPEGTNSFVPLVMMKVAAPWQQSIPLKDCEKSILLIFRTMPDIGIGCILEEKQTGFEGGK